MGQDSSQIDGQTHNADGVVIKRDPEEKENENIRDVSNWGGSAVEEGLIRNSTMKAPEGRKKKRRKRRSSPASKATFETAKDRLESKSVGEGRGTPTLPRHALEVAQTNGVRGTPSSASRNPKLAEIETKKRRLLAVVSAAAGDIDGPYSDTETNMCGRDESDHVEQEGGDEKNHGSGRPAKKSNKSRLTAKRALSGEANGRWTSEATQGTEESSASKKVKNKKSKSRLVSASLAADEGEDEPAAGLQLPTPNASSQVQRRQPLEDQFTTHNIKDSQIPKKRSSILDSKSSAAGQKQLKDSLKMPHTDEDTSDEDLTGDSPRSREHQSVRNTFSSYHNIPPPNTQTNVASIRRQSFDQNMDFIDPALRDSGMNSNQQPRQIGIYRDVATSQTTETRKRRLPVREDDFELTSDSEPKTKKPRKQLLKPKTSKTSDRKSIIHEFREESPDLDAPSTKIKGRRSTQKKAKKHEPTAKGKFSKDELDIIENKILKYREMNDITAFDLNQILQDAPRKLASLWDEMCEALPDRPRQAIVKVCTRKFHNFGVRGKWTKEEDQELKEVYQRFPKRWKQIGQILNRHHEDVRDRWRNYLVCGDNMKRESWTEEEENNLRAVVGEQIQAIRELKAAKIAENPDMTHDPRPDIELIDWQLVSEKFGRTRSRLQCLEKWNRMTKLEDSEGDSKELEFEPTSWRVKNAIRDVKYMRREDYLELLIALRNSHSGREGKVNWGKLGDLDLRVKWTCMARKVAWKKLRASVPGNEKMKFQDIVTLLLNNLPENDAELEGAGGVVDAVPRNTFEADTPSPQRRSLSDAISSAGEEENENIDPNLNSEGIQECHSSLSGSYQSRNLNKNMLREVVGEAYFDRGDTDGEVEDGDVAMADHESVDLDRPSQLKGARSSVSRLRSPISFIAAPNQKQPEYIDTSTHSDEENVDMDIPARRPTRRSRPESVDLDMD